MAKNVVVLVRQEGLGAVASEDAVFGIDMFDRFLHSLEAQEVKPAAICLYTSGVKLACAGSKAVFGLQLLQGLGVRICICRTCLEYYGLLDDVKVGEVGTMSDIVRLLIDADHVVTV